MLKLASKSRQSVLEGAVLDVRRFLQTSCAVMIGYVVILHVK